MLARLTPAFEVFATASEWASAAADCLAGALAAGVAARGGASLAASGGATPAPIYQALSEKRLDWPAVTVTLADERDAPTGHPASNERLVRERLLINRAAKARFLPLRQAERLALPLDAALFGMGADAHTLSWFPGGRGLAAALTEPAVVARVTPNPLPPDAPFARWTLSRSAVADCRCAVLAITGARKRAVLEAALSPGRSEEQAPIRALIAALGPRLTVFWTP